MFLLRHLEAFNKHYRQYSNNLRLVVVQTTCDQPDINHARGPNASFLHFEMHMRPAHLIIFATLQIDSRLTGFYVNIIFDFL